MKMISGYKINKRIGYLIMIFACRAKSKGGDWSKLQGETLAVSRLKVALRWNAYIFLYAIYALYTGVLF